MQNLEADGIITVYDIQTGAIVAQYEGLDVVRAIADKDAQLSAVLEGQNQLKAQTVRIRKILTGGMEREGVDTEQIAREVMAEIEKLEAENETLRKWAKEE